MVSEIQAYIENQSAVDQEICKKLAELIGSHMPEAESKIWHAHPVWFLNGNPIAGFSKQKAGIRLMFWSGADFDEESLNVKGKNFKDASVFYTHKDQIVQQDLIRWIQKSKEIQWDYKKLAKRKGKLEKLL